MAKVWTDENIQILISFLRNGFSNKEIARKMNVSVDAISGAIGRYDLRCHIVPKPSTSKFIDNLDLGELDDKQFEKDKERARLKWKIKTSKKQKIKKPYEIGIFIPDEHIPHHNEPANKCVLKIMHDFLFDKCVLMGDFMDLSCISHWNKNRHRTLEMQRLKSDYIVGNALLDEFDKRLPKDCDKYYLEGNHECLDDKTELLTKRGWIKHDEIDTSDIVLSLNPVTELGEWVNIDNLIRKEFDGYMNHLDTKTIDLMATDDHKIFNFNRRNKKYEYIPIKNLTGNRYQIPVNCLVEENKKFDISNEMLQLIAWVLTDGSVTKDYSYIRLYQSKPTHKDIECLLKKLDLKYRRLERDRNITEICGVKLLQKPLQQKEFHLDTVSSKIISKYLKNNTRDLPDWVSKLNSKQFKLFLDTIIKGDGSKHIAGKTARMLYGKKDFLESVQTECVLRGMSATLSVYRETQYRLNICDRKRFSFNGICDFKKTYYKGIVWDLTVKNHNFLIRRNGKCHFTGNCWAEQMVEEMPALEGLVEPKTMLNLEERGYKYSKYNELVKIGRLYATHGIYAGANPIKKHIDELKVNTIFGHTHTMGMYLSPSCAREIAFAGYNAGCLCDLSPDYMKNRPNAWNHGFAVGYFYPNGYFDVQLVRIVNGKCIFNMKEYDGNK